MDICGITVEGDRTGPGQHGPSAFARFEEGLAVHVQISVVQSSGGSRQQGVDEHVVLQDHVLALGRPQGPKQLLSLR